MLTAMGYDGLFVAKERSPNLNFGYYSDGVALFWRRGRFQLDREISNFKNMYIMKPAASSCGRGIKVIGKK